MQNGKAATPGLPLRWTRSELNIHRSAVAVALNKSMLSINNGASGKVLKIQNVFIVNSQITAVVGNVVLARIESLPVNHRGS